VSDTVVFIPAWNEESNLPGVLDELHQELPEVDVLVIDDGSTDRTADVAREHGADVFSFPRTAGSARGSRPATSRRRSAATRSAVASTRTASTPRRS
jgi:glycosyltransferase involved in cell wall biosynthesis